MNFNEDTSFIEYPVTEPTQDFVTNFDTIGGTTDAVLVTVDGVLTDAPESLYTAQQINHTTWRVTPEVQAGSVVRLYRFTDIDEMMHVFTAGAKFIPRNMDNNFKQIRHAQQEVRDAFDFLEYNTLGVVEAARDATDRANDVVDEVEGLLDKELNHNDLRGRGVANAHPDSAITTWSGRSQEDHNKDFKHLKDFGCTPNNPDFNNAPFITQALESGDKIYFGDQNCIYYVDEPVSVTLSSRLQYESSGAKIICKNVVNRVISIDMDGNSIFGEGELFADADLKAFTGIYIMNHSTRRADVVLKNPSVINCRRSSTTFTGGDGIYVVGNLGRVLIDEPYIDGVYMAAGAGVVGSQGVSGITVVRSLTAVEYIPEMVEIRSPRIENIRSEDLSYTSDQDGIRIFTRHSQAQVLPSRTTAVITNPYFKNCIGRAVKSQGEIVTVDTPMVFRDISGAGGNVEFDFQTGGGKLINAYCIYKNTMPTSIVYLYGSENETKNIGLQIGSIEGLNVSIEYDTPYVHTPELIKISFNNGNDYSDVLIHDVNVRGKNFKANTFLQISRVGTTPQRATVNLVDCSAPISASGAVFSAQDGFEGYGLVVNPHRFKNTGGAACNMTSSRIQNFAAVNPLDCQGIVSSRLGSADFPANYINGFREYGELPVVGDRRGGGNVRFGKYRLTSGLNTINIGGFVSSGLRANIVLLSIARTKNHTAIISTDATGCIGLSVGSEISIGDNAPSVSPKAVDVYVTDNGETLNINNSIGGTVFMTLQMLG